MPEFRYYCLNDAGKIMRGVHVTASTLAEAIQTAHRDCAAHPARSSDIVVWQDDRCDVQGLISNDLDDNNVIVMLDDAKKQITATDGLIHQITPGHA